MKDDQCDTDRTTITGYHCIGKSRKNKKDWIIYVAVSDWKHLRQTKILISANELQVSAIDRDHYLSKIATDKWLLLLSLLIKLEHSEDKSSAAYESNGWKV